MNATLGTISASGLYQAPATAPANSGLTIKAQSTAYPSSFKTTSLTVIRPYPWLWSVSPPSLQTGNFAINLNGANFAPDAVVQANGVDLPTVYVSKTSLKATGLAATTGPIKCAVRLPGPGPVTGNQVSATVSVPTISVTVAPSVASVPLGNSQNFSATVSGSANTSVTWSVLGGSANGTVTSGGVYSAPLSLPNPATVTLRATSVANALVSADATIMLVPPPVLVAISPATATVQIGSTKPFYASGTGTLTTAVTWTVLGGAAHGTITVAGVFVTPAVMPAPPTVTVRATAVADVNATADAMLPWMNVLSQQAFGNYRDLLRDVTKCPSMGKYLDLANSSKPSSGGAANENYPRELMQLFSFGLWQLNLDGSRQLDANNNPISTYTQADVAQNALALTGWGYGQPPSGPVYEWFGGPMVPHPQNHDLNAKMVLGTTIPAGQSVQADLESVLNILMNHPNTAPFIATRLIRSLVLSNPSGGYIQRVAQVFANTGGDLPATLTAILTDSEARNDVPSVNSGRLKEPILHTCAFLRALNGHFNNPNTLVYVYAYMAQSPLNAPSVFSWFSPMYRVPKSPLFGPEFQIYSPMEATLRGNLFHYMLSNPGSADFTLDLTPFQPFGNDMPGLVELVNQKLLYGRMTPAMKQALIDAATPGYDAATRIQTVLYLTALSGQYTVQH